MQERDHVPRWTSYGGSAVSTRARMHLSRLDCHPTGHHAGYIFGSRTYLPPRRRAVQAAFGTGAEQNLQRVAPSGISDRHSGHGWVVTAAGPLIRANSFCVGSTIRK